MEIMTFDFHKVFFCSFHLRIFKMKFLHEISSTPQAEKNTVKINENFWFFLTFENVHQKEDEHWERRDVKSQGLVNEKTTSVSSSSLSSLSNNRKISSRWTYSNELNLTLCVCSPGREISFSIIFLSEKEREMMMIKILISRIMNS